MKPDRRQFLRGVGAAALSAGTASALGASLGAFQAHAADTGGYKALVCVFLLGGLDNHDTVLPFDVASYDRYAEIRADLMAQYANNAGGSSRARDRLLPLTPANAADFGGREFALPEELSGLQGLFQSGDAAIVGNVGPLLAPLTKAEFEADSPNTPKRLFSHNDQQSTWMSSAPEGAMFDWGGRFADAALNSGANAARDFTTITSLGNELFLTGETAQPYQIGLNGAPENETLQFFGFGRGSPEGEALYQQLRDHFRASDFAGSNLLARDMAEKMRSALETNELFNQSLESAPALTTVFPNTFIGQQLRAVAQTISIRDSLLMNRQVFLVADGGFDTHSRQAADMPTLQSEFDGAITAFHAAMQELGIGNDVTLFTASDFGRTLAINGDGTDHGWGAHHFVVGGAVQGGSIYGDIPPYDFDHERDAGGGRLIPDVSVEQFAAPLGRWFGLTDSELAAALPNLSSFPSALAYI